MRIIQKALTFDDVLLVPAYSNVLPRDVSLRTQLTRNINLNIPLLSAAMDTVTETRLAIALAQEGGIGIIHKNMSAQAQAAKVAKVKRFESGVVKDPITITPDMTVRSVIELDAPAQDFRIAGGAGQATGRHRHQSRSAFREQSGSADTKHHDAARAADHRQGERQPGRSAQPDAQASYRARAGGQRCVRVARPDDGQGHPEIQRTPVGLQRQLRPSACRRGGRRGRGHG